MTVFEKDVDLFLDHHGVKGMRWGTRKSVGSFKTTGSGQQRTGKQKAFIATVGTASVLLGLKFMQSSSLKTPLAVAGGGAIALAGIQGSKSILEMRGQRKLSDV